MLPAHRDTLARAAGDGDHVGFMEGKPGGEARADLGKPTAA
jgi:hypothetical protein